MTDTGPDVSGYNPGVDGRAVLRAGHHFLMVKATEGTGYINPDLAQQVAGARAAGIPVGFYHFVDPGNGAAQGQHFVAVTAPLLRPGDLGLWVDFESGSHDDLHAILDALDRVQPTTHGGIYTGEWYWGPHGSSSCGRCGSRNLWLASYTAAQPPTPAPWRTTAMWQFTDRDTSVTGYSLDMSTTNVLAQLIGSTSGGFLMSLSDAEQAELLTRVRNIPGDVWTVPRIDFGPAQVSQQPPYALLATASSASLTASALAGKSGAVDVTALAAALAAQLPAADLAALAAKLQVTVKP